jgi:hypothetical protein
MRSVAALEMLSEVLGVNTESFSREEILLLEAELYARIWEELRTSFKNCFKEYFRSMKFNAQMENAMIESNFLRCLINDIVATETYTLSGIALYTQMPEDMISDLVTGCHNNPTFLLPRKLIELHREARPDLYRRIVKKIAETQHEYGEEKC